MNEILAIAEGTWRRILRMRVVYFLILCVLILIGNAVNYDVLSMQEHKPLMIDVSLVLNTIAVVLVVISMTFEIPRELREGVASTLLTKPLGRTQYLIGKVVGTVVTSLVVSAIIALGFFIIFSFAFNEKFGLQMLFSHLLVMASSLPMAAIAVLFSVVLPEMISPIVTALVIWFSFSTYNISSLKLVYGGILPDLNIYNLKAFAVYGKDIPWAYLGTAVVWGIVYSIFATALASLIFRSKDIR